jgi:hypothetical protein
MNRNMKITLFDIVGEEGNFGVMAQEQRRKMNKMLDRCIVLPKSILSDSSLTMFDIHVYSEILWLAIDPTHNLSRYEPYGVAEFNPKHILQETDSFKGKTDDSVMLSISKLEKAGHITVKLTRPDKWMHISIYFEDFWAVLNTVFFDGNFEELFFSEESKEGKDEQV